MTDLIKITALTNIGANISHTTIVPVVNMTGTPLTQKSNLQNFGNLILSGAGGSYFVPAAQANIAQTVSNAAQPNITSVGTLTSANVTGNLSAGNANLGNLVIANFFSGDGGLLSNITSSYGDSNVASYLPNYTGNISGNNSNFTSNVSANIVDANYVYGDGSNISNLAVANVTGLGNVATINIDGNAGNVLLGNGVFGQATAGNISGLGNIATINIDGNAANVLLGNGVFSGVPLYPNAVVWTSVPASNVSLGVEGQAAYDVGGNLYVCVTANLWAKFTGTTSW